MLWVLIGLLVLTPWIELHHRDLRWRALLEAVWFRFSVLMIDAALMGQSSCRLANSEHVVSDLGVNNYILFHLVADLSSIVISSDLDLSLGFSVCSRTVALERSLSCHVRWWPMTSEQWVGDVYFSPFISLFSLFGTYDRDGLKTTVFTQHKTSNQRW